MMNKSRQVEMTVHAICDSLSEEWGDRVLYALGNLNSLTMKQLRGIEQLADLANDIEEQS